MKPDVEETTRFAIEQVSGDEWLIGWRDIRLLALGSRCLLETGDKVLFIADTHFGKATTFRRAGIPVPSGTTDSMLERLSAVLKKYEVEELCVLGDFFHSRTALATDYTEELLAWRQDWHSLPIRVVEGNHDRGQAKLFKKLNIQVDDEPHQRGQLELCHFPDMASEEPRNLLRLAGHEHPAVKISDGIQSLKTPCFSLRPNLIVLPAFGEFTGSSIVKPQAGFPCLCCAGHSLLRYPAS